MSKKFSSGYKVPCFEKKKNEITMQNCNSNFIKSSLFLHCGSFHPIWLVFVLFDKVRLGVTTYLTRSLFSYLHCVKEDFSTMQWQHSGPEFYETSSHLIYFKAIFDFESDNRPGKLNWE